MSYFTNKRGTLKNARSWVANKQGSDVNESVDDQKIRHQHTQRAEFGDVFATQFVRSLEAYGANLDGIDLPALTRQVEAASAGWLDVALQHEDPAAERKIKSHSDAFEARKTGHENLGALGEQYGVALSSLQADIWPDWTQEKKLGALADKAMEHALAAMKSQSHAQGL